MRRAAVCRARASARVTSRPPLPELFHELARTPFAAANDHEGLARLHVERLSDGYRTRNGALALLSETHDGPAPRAGLDTRVRARRADRHLAVRRPSPQDPPRPPVGDARLPRRFGLRARFLRRLSRGHDVGFRLRARRAVAVVHRRPRRARPPGAHRRRRADARARRPPARRARARARARAAVGRRGRCHARRSIGHRDRHARDARVRRPARRRAEAAAAPVGAARAAREGDAGGGRDVGGRNRACMPRVARLLHQRVQRDDGQDAASVADRATHRSGEASARARRLDARAHRRALRLLEPEPFHAELREGHRPAARRGRRRARA